VHHLTPRRLPFLLSAALLILFAWSTPVEGMFEACNLDDSEETLMEACGEESGCILCSAECREGTGANILDCDYACGGATCDPD